MKKIIVMTSFLALFAFASCEKEKELEDKLGGNSGMEDSYGLTTQEFAQIDSIKNEIKNEIKLGDSLMIADLKMEIEMLKEEIRLLKEKK